LLVQGVVAQLVSFGATPPQELKGVEENVSFSLPKELRPSGGRA
jgi:4-hydroxy-3-methylbut-2-enyl diphosphate reductase